MMTQQLNTKDKLATLFHTQRRQCLSKQWIPKISLTQIISFLFADDLAIFSVYWKPAPLQVLLLSVKRLSKIAGKLPAMEYIFSKVTG